MVLLLCSAFGRLVIAIGGGGAFVMRLGFTEWADKGAAHDVDEEDKEEYEVEEEDVEGCRDWYCGIHNGCLRFMCLFSSF